jgi:hypothetical protein
MTNSSTTRLTTATSSAFVTVLDDAHALAESGLPVFPCSISTKRPATPHGFKDASNDPDEIRHLWRDHPGGLIGVPTGAITGFDVLDLDRKHETASRWWPENQLRMPVTRTHRTRSGGFHLLFEHAASVRCSAGKIALGVDTRADGGYVIWWPATGLPVLSDAPIAPWPEWLLESFRPKSRPPSRFQIAPPSNNRLLTKLVPDGRRCPRG